MKTTLYIITLYITFTLAAKSVDAIRLHLDKYKDHPQSITQIRIASTSIMPEKWEKEKNWQKIERQVTRAATEFDADIVVTPEGVLEGYVINQVNDVEDPEEKKRIVQKFLHLAEPLDGPYIQKACSLADYLNIYFLLGFLEKDHKNLYNTAIFIDPDGDIIARYRKTHFAQGYEINPTCYQPGSRFPVFDTPFGKIGILICYDRQLPEPARILALKGAQILFVPAYGSYTDRDGWNTILLRTRAYENRLPLIFSHPNQSLLISHKGTLEAICDEGEIAYYEVDTTPEKNKGCFRNRRPEMYRIIYEPR